MCRFAEYRLIVLGVALLAGCRLPVQGYTFQEVGAEPRAGDSVLATERDEFEAWTVERVSDLRRCLDEHAGVPHEASASIASELEDAAVDWKTFLVKTDDAFKFPVMAYANHTWFQLRQWADWHRNMQIVTGRREEASALLPDGRVPNSAFYTRTDIASYTPERLRQEFSAIMPVGKITITKEKKDGTSEGFFGKDQRGTEYIFIFDAPFNPEMQTAAEHIGSTLVRTMGWRVPRTVVCTVDGTGNPQYDGRRATATIAIKKLAGHWTYRSYRNRREIRGLATVAAWLNNVDQTEHNTGISEVADGVYTYYVWDYGASLGSFTFRPKWPRLGWQYFFDPIRQPLAVLLGPSWQRCGRQQSAAVGYFTDEFDPEEWVPFYPNLAFEDTTPTDRRWAAARIAQISDDQIRTVVESARYAHTSDADYVTATLIARRDRIVEYFLANRSHLLLDLDQSE